ncbi:MAG TPA: lytic transglycosylase domain-containing protein [Stellaceae bacterium]|nr:lytic transglycosylase domain-containing protein [Stellaceae bacterium]
MQVTAPAAADVGGGNRFDPAQNVALGRAYLAYMFRRFGSWPDAVAAYNWGPGNLDFWIRSGRSPGKMPPGVERYRNRVLAAAELPMPKGADLGGGWAAAPRRPHLRGIAHAQPHRMGVAARAGIGDAEIASLYTQLMRASAPP